jgi:hypothetical protein
MNLEQRLAFSVTARRRRPHNSWCARCKLPWPECNSHVTMYSENEGCFPLCEDCWQELGTPSARLPYYRSMVVWWNTMSEPDPERDRLIFTAVIEEE